MLPWSPLFLYICSLGVHPGTGAAINGVLDLAFEGSGLCRRSVVVLGRRCLDKDLEEILRGKGDF